MSTSRLAPGVQKVNLCYSSQNLDATDDPTSLVQLRRKGNALEVSFDKLHFQ
jgi:hypothetical protein